MEQTIRLNPSDLTDVVCDECSHNTFKEVVFIKKVSALISPNGRESFVPVATFACSKCGHVNTAFKQEQR